MMKNLAKFMEDEELMTIFSSVKDQFSVDLERILFIKRNVDMDIARV